MAKKKEQTVVETLKALYNLQKIDSELDKIKILRGELPMEVKDLEDEIVGMETRIGRLESRIAEIDQEILGHQAVIKNAESLIAKYKNC